MSHEYSVILNGEISQYAKREDVIIAFAKLAKLDAAKAEHIFNSAPITIKKNIDRDTAQKFVAALDKIGAGATVEPAVEQAQALATETATTAENQAVVAQPDAQQQPCPGLTYTIEGQPDYAFLTVEIPVNETLKVEASSMATMDTNLRMKTKFRGGVSRFLTGESIFINEFTAEGGPGEIGIAPGSPGDMAHVYLNDEAIYLQN